MVSNNVVPNASKSPTASRFLTGASSLVLLQILTRIVTFLLNQALVRLSTPQIFGTAAIQFELLLTSILFISREGVRLALLRAPDETTKQSGEKVEEANNKIESTEQANSTRNRKQKKKTDPTTKEEKQVTSPAISTAQDQVLASNIATLPFLAGIPMAIILSIAYATTASEETRRQPYFYISIAAYTLSALLQLASEPMYILAQQELEFTVRMKSEAAGVIFRAAVTVGILAANTGGDHDLGLLAFASGQLAYGILVLAIYLWTYRSRLSDWRWWPKSVITVQKGHKKSRLFDPVLFTLTKSMTLQSFIKHLLTEGDKVAVARTSKLADQGGYAVASNYGSLVARIIFQPFEEMSRVYFSKTLSICTIDEDQATVDQRRRQSPLDRTVKEKVDDIPLSTAQQTALKRASDTLHTLLLLETHLLLLLITFLPPYLPVLLSHFLPKKYLVTSAPSILQAYAYYLPTMSLNGLLEAFAFSVMSPPDVRIQTRWLFVTSVSFAIFVWLFCDRLGFGDVGLVYANVASLGMRAAWAALFSDRWFKRMWSRGIKNDDGDKNTENSADHQRQLASPTGISLRNILPPYSVLILFAIASQVVRYSQRLYGLTQDNLAEQQRSHALLKAQAQHIIIGGICALICLAECYRSQRTHLKTLTLLVKSRSS